MARMVSYFKNGVWGLVWYLVITILKGLSQFQDMAAERERDRV